MQAARSIFEPRGPAAREEALGDLRRAADLGEAGAMRQLGERLMVGRDAPLDRGQATVLLSAAAEAGDARALGIMATLAAVGALGQPDWPGALAHLARAAEVGGESARAQLRLLARRASDPAAPDGWRSLAEGVDIGAWIAPPPRRALAEAPRVRSAPAFADAAVCDWLIERVRGRMRAATMYDGVSKIESVDPHRTCSDYQFDIIETDLVVLLVRERIAALTRLPTVAMEPPRVFHYAPGEQIKPHYDRCNDDRSGYKDSGYRGDRIVTFLLYLNDDFDGGELEFPKTGLRCKGARGDAIYFAHVDTEGRQDPLSLHAGLTIRRGEKWVLSQWIHDRPFGAPEPGGA